ncbi:hypothetical protein Y1Q_0021084 [Alligator mississippiensis]|uniref:Uncharacterized protein n=1 Tax=Alligator mississippiensis TaxID=8496 RepID=A0A151NRS1_ALLMI|nr:hypothetical protein Y1Q_0021084 [Alligator mississippiensis]
MIKESEGQSCRELAEYGGGYTSFWKGKSEKDKHIHSNDFAIKTKIVTQMPECLVGINKDFMTFHLQLTIKQHTTVISADVLPFDADEETEENSKLDQVQRNQPLDRRTRCYAFIMSVEEMQKYGKELILKKISQKRLGELTLLAVGAKQMKTTNLHWIYNDFSVKYSLQRFISNSLVLGSELC